MRLAKILLALATVALTTTACGGNIGGSLVKGGIFGDGPRPEWLDTAPKKYPNAAYLLGRGQASTEAEARDRARGDLAKIFEVRVEVVTSSHTTLSETGGREQVTRNATQQVSAKTDKVINGINVVETWRDPATKDIHALAVLSRSQASASLEEEIGKIDAAVRLQMDKARGMSDPLLKIGALSRALDTAVKRDGYQAMLKVVDPAGIGIPSPMPQADIQSRIDDSIKQIQIAPQVAEDSGMNEFARILKGGLAAAGFLADDAARADLILIGKLTLSDLGRRDGWNWMRGTLEVSLVERQSGRVRGSRTWPLKASAQEATTAKSRVLQEAEKVLKQELRPAIIEFASS